jgi:hypothetical protein
MDEMNQTSKNRMVLLLIGGIPLTMILAATWLWYFVVQGDLDLVSMLGTANRGSLVQPPRQLDDYPLVDQEGVEFNYAELKPKWAMLVPAAGPDCDRSCEQTLYVTRQIHVAIGKEFNRLRRLYVSKTALENTALAVPELSDQRPAPDNFTVYLKQEHRGLKALILGAGQYGQLFSEQEADPSTWYLVDPAGWVMMSYNSDVPYKDVISDLKFLLKNSSE